MMKKEVLKARVDELAERAWDIPAIEARYKKLAAEGIPKKTLSREAILPKKKQILDRVQQRAEEYNFFTKNCAQGTALSLLEEFGLGNMEGLLNTPRRLSSRRSAPACRLARSRHP